LILYGGLGAVFDFLPEAPYQRHPPGLEGVGLFLFLRAFASGCTALTGVEAVSDGVPAFKPPEAHNARIVLTVLGVILIVLFLGITFLAYDFGIAPRPEETVVSQLARHVFGGGALYFEIQAVTMLILLLAANTSFADFPRLSFFLARDRFIPRQFATQGDRLVFSNGILILGGLAALLLVIFGGDTHALIPLYAVGVFLSFTLSQASMVRRWFRLREEGWWWRAWLNALAQRQGRLRRDRSRAHAAARGEVGQVRDGGAADRADLALPVVARPAHRVYRPPAAAGREPRGHDRAARVHPGPLVAARAPQP